jgi:hypothetical protein
MREILLNGNIKIVYEKNIYKIDFKYSCYQLIKSLLKTNIIQGGTCDEYYKTIKFRAESVKTLKEYIKEKTLINSRKGLFISDTAKLIKSLSRQLDYLIRSEFCVFLGYNPEEIIVINDEKFAFLGSELVVSINPENEMAMISSPFSKRNFFISPELFLVTEIPYYIHYKTSYFSLGLFIIYVLLGDDNFYNDYLLNNYSEKVLDILDNHIIKNTRIYWLLSRCLVEDPRKRSIILI